MDQVAFVGSSSAFGQFHPETGLVDSSGVSRSAIDLIGRNLIGECRFENAVHLDEGVTEVNGIELMWKELSRSAVASNHSRIILQANGAAGPDIPSYLTLLADEKDWAQNELGPRYVGIEESDFKAKRLGTWPGGILEQIDLLFEKTDDGVIVFDRDNYIWCLWFLLLIANQRGETGKLGYDSLQHTTCVFVTTESEKSTSALSKGGTAFISNRSDSGYDISWDDSSWNPISSGFILG